jgi:hypothetical protein
MRKISRLNGVPENSSIASSFNLFHYCDSYKVEIYKEDSIDNITTKIFQTPRWADSLMRLRNALARLVGLDTGGYKRDTYISDYYHVGSRAVYFTVIDRNDNEILMAENDKHLDFRISVLMNRQSSDITIFLTTLVKFNNSLGRIYFLLVKPFHRIIIFSLLKRLIKENN